METNPLICSANQWTGFCITETSIMKDLRGSSSTYIDSLFLHFVKHNLLFLFSSLSAFSFTNIHDSQDNRCSWRLSPYILSITSTCFTDTQTLAALLVQTINLCAQLAPGIEDGTFGTRFLEFTLFTLALVAAVVAVVRRVLKTRVTLGNISHVLLNLD